VGAGAKTVIPARASPSFDAPGPTSGPTKSTSSTATSCAASRRGIQFNIKLAQADPVVISTDNQYIAPRPAMREVSSQGYGLHPLRWLDSRCGRLRKVVKDPSVMMGFGLPDDNLHAPNEKFSHPQLLQWD